MPILSRKRRRTDDLPSDALPSDGTIDVPQPINVPLVVEPIDMSSSEDEDSDDSDKDSDEDFVDDSLDDSNIGKSLVERLLTLSENTDDWTDGLTQEKIDKLKPMYDGIQQKLRDETPTVSKILEANLTESEKKRCLQMLDAMNSNLPGSMPFYEMRNALIDSLEKSASPHNIDDIAREEARITAILSDTQNMKQKILSLNVPDTIKTSLYAKYLKLDKMDISDTCYSTLKDQIEWSLQLPYTKRYNRDDGRTSVNNTEFLVRVATELDRNLFGLNDVKERLLLILNDSLHSPHAEKTIALCGPSGIGKTAIAKTFAIATGLPFEHISLGGARDSTMFYGSDNVYIGAGPGIIVRTLCNMKCSDGVILFDELDKLASTPEGQEMQYALLHIADYVQNSAFRDKYLSDVKIDISNLWFFYSMNTDEFLDKALKNRLSIINIRAYTFPEKAVITKDYMLPAIIEKIGMSRMDVTMTDDAIHRIVSMCSDDEGVRGIKDVLKTIASKVNLYRTIGDPLKIRIKISFQIDNFSLPLNITCDVLHHLLSSDVRDKVRESKMCYFS